MNLIFVLTLWSSLKTALHLYQAVSISVYDVTNIRSFENARRTWMPNVDAVSALRRRVVLFI